MITVSVYSHLMKYQAKRKYLLSSHVKNNKLKEVVYQKYKSKNENSQGDKHLTFLL